MIQRIQTLYLILASLANLSVYFTPLWTRADEDPSLWIKAGFAAGLLLAAVVTVWSVFRFANRPDQMRWIKRAMAFQMLAVGAALGLVVTLGGFGRFMLPELVSFGLPLLALLLQWMGLRGVAADDALVRSMDRLR